MTGKFILWAQALDNASPDHFEFRGEALTADDTVRRQEGVSSVSTVIKKGTRLFDVSGVLLTADERNFVLEVPSAQRDRAGRTAPLVCYGEYDASEGDALGASAAVALDDFAKRIGRTLQPEHFELVRTSFKAREKKSSKLVRAAGIVVATLVLLFTVYWLAQTGG